MYDAVTRVAATATGAETAFRHIAILNDYVRVPYATGSTFAAQFLHREFTRRGHDVTLVGPRDPNAKSTELPDRHVLLPSIPVRAQPGFFLPVPTRTGLRELQGQRFDVMVGQTGSALMDAGVWLRTTQRVPLLCVNTTLLSRLYDTLLPESVAEQRWVHRLVERTGVPFIEHLSAQIYNQSDGLIVLSRGLERYWRRAGVQVPIHVIPRTVDPRVADSDAGPDPFSPRAKRGFRLLVLCRLVREKGVARIIDMFARHIAPQVPEATLTLVGDGADHDAFKARAERLGVGAKTFFPGEFPVDQVRTWYHHADVFMYASLSETYGQVVSEAMWAGLPVVAFDDDAGVAQQIEHGRDGLLLPPGPDEAECNSRFAAEVVRLLHEPSRRRWLAEAAQRSARLRSDPARCVDRYYQAFEQARRHRALSNPDQSTWGRTMPLVRWMATHAVVGAAGQIRPPSALNRHGRKQPSWGEGAPSKSSSSDGEAA
jgi:glycosyltransferase involved in cell wall biosynthesis